MLGKPNSISIVHKTILVCLLLAPFCSASDHHRRDWDYEETRNESHDFVSGGMVHVRLSVGDLRITRGNSSKIQVRYTIKSHHESRVKDARLDFNVGGRDAELDFHASSSGTSIDVELEVPPNTNLDVHDKVGDLTVEEIEGDKDLELGVGDIRIVSKASAYHLVRASSGIGDVNGDVTDHETAEVSGWLGKTLKYHGDGKYELHAHVGVGDINLEDR